MSVGDADLRPCLDLADLAKTLAARSKTEVRSGWNRVGSANPICGLCGDFLAEFGSNSAMRLEGLEPPTNGLEGRRSSSELQALDATTA